MWRLPGYITRDHSSTAVACEDSSDQLRHEVYRITDYAHAIMLKGSLKNEDLPPIPKGRERSFGFPEEYEMEFLGQMFDLGTGESLQKPEALSIINEICDFALHFEEFATMARNERWQLRSYRYGPDIITRYMSFLTGKPDKDDEARNSEELLIVLRRWGKHGERQMEVRQWLEKSSALIEKVGKLLIKNSIPVGVKEDEPKLARRRK